MILPALTLGLVLYGEYTLIVRSAMLETLGEDYVLTARAKGLSNWAIVWKHGLRNAMLPIVTLIALSLGFIIGGAITVEYVFDYPGIGLAIVDAIDKRDYAVPAGRVPGADAVGDPVQLRRRPAVLQARSAGDDMSDVDHRAAGCARRSRRAAEDVGRARRRAGAASSRRPCSASRRRIVGLTVVLLFILIAIFAPAASRRTASTRRPARSTRRPAARTGWAPTTAASTCSRC